MKVGYFGTGALAATAVRCLAKEHQVLVVHNAGNRELMECGATAVGTLSLLVQTSDALIMNFNSHQEVRDALFSTDGIAQAIVPGKILIDQTPCDPDQFRELANELSKCGVALVDAPVHWEHSDELPDGTQIMCGGSASAVEEARPLLESLCKKVIYCGESGSGQAVRLVVAAVAACNRLVTYECAAVGVTNGLALEDMATVLNKSSGYNSASARVLPALATGHRTAEISLDAVVEDLKMASRMAMRSGAPMLIANLAWCILEGAAKEFGGSKSLDELAKIVERSSGIEFAA